MSQEMEVATGVSRRRRWTAERKAQLLQALAASGVGPTAFCRQHRISQTSFGRWRRVGAEEPSGFTLVQLPHARSAGLTPSVGVTLRLSWPAGPAAEFTGLDAATMEVVIRTLDALARSAGG